MLIDLGTEAPMKLRGLFNSNKNLTMETTTITYKATLGNGTAIERTFEETFARGSEPSFSLWKYGAALDALEPMGHTMKYYINNELKLGNW